MGVVGDLRKCAGENWYGPQIYERYPQVPVNSYSSMSLVARSRVGPELFAPMLRRAVWLVDKDEPAAIQTT